ncbi:RidA family protein [Aminivibrio sp.]|jgi:2-iminobutanoate/2-iminopropanoate deaminase|uniref:RidA family protein n=1 Tax=Aminivibrio sp. TaxID=1872489 RepID=UPI001A4B1AF8|nr:Rid family detoxifying hydrolase [Aminivibrio sp.]MBL3538124.1 RidA family protein [Aminivibrio sp.]MDK2959006.1 2-iminobutanoate/2-iminopropanoate deaminase [Synergistaceae bacterium]
MRFISTEDAPRPGGHYSQAVEHQGVVYVAGQLPIVPGTGEKCLGTVEEQTKRALLNLEAVLKASGSGRDRVLRVTVYVSDISLWGRVNTVYAEFFGDHKPARTVVPTRDLHYGFLVEIDAIAATASGRTEEK